MRYSLPTDRLVNRLIPHFLPGRRYILFVQSLVYPLKALNDSFRDFAREKLIEANMTSQVIYFEWYLNHKFGKYLKNKQEGIFIRDSRTVGVDIYFEKAGNGKPCTLWYESEQVNTGNPEEDPKRFYFTDEEKAVNRVSFLICVPEISIAEKEFVYMLSYTVNTYRLAGKTYLIKIDTREFEPNKKTGI
jgi:hypothetical protein